MRSLIGLKERILILVAALASLTILVGLILYWYSYQTGHFFMTVVEEHLTALEAANRLESALVMQKGYLTYFFQDGNSYWLKELEQRNMEFNDWLERTEHLTETPEKLAILEHIETDYHLLMEQRDKVIALYREGRNREGYEIHQKARQDFFKILDLCQEFRLCHKKSINQARDKIIAYKAGATRISLVAMVIAACLSVILAMVLFRQVLRPIRLLAREAGGGFAPNRRVTDEVQALSHGVHTLMEDIDHTKSELETSRAHLVQSAKMASVGKLAASVAHSIRNPLTSVKMRLFSLERSLDLSEGHREDFMVISEEIRHIDNVLRNFLEFSRRPKLQMQSVSVSEVIDMAIDLIHPRLASHDIELSLKRSGPLPEIKLDPGQLKEALVNLMVNSAEALDQGGGIVIEEGQDEDALLGRVVVINIRDNGPGVPESIQDQIFQPFFSTKEEGTGLGLSISARIIEEHGGRISLLSSAEVGTLFTIRLPV